MTRTFRIFGGEGFVGAERKGGCLESVHGTVHTKWLGGLMGKAATAVCDPIFWLHHAYVDTLWWDWQQTHTGGPLSLDASLQGIPGPWVVRNVLDPRSSELVYEYMAGQFSIRDRPFDERTRAASVEITIPPNITCLRLMLGDVRFEGTGEPSDGLDVEVKGDVSGHGRVSFFGLGHQHGGHGFVSNCSSEPPGDMFSCITLQRNDRCASATATMVLTATWPVGAGGPARFSVGRIVVEMDDCC